MTPHTLLLSAAGLLLFCPTLPVAEPCVLYLPQPATQGQHGGFISHVVCSYNDAVKEGHVYDTKVVITVTVAKFMEGWEMNLQFAKNDTVIVKSVRGAQVLGGETRENGSVVFRNRVPCLNEADSFRMSFTVKHGEPGVNLFPARLHAKQPPPRQLDGLCDGPTITIANTLFNRFKLKNSKYVTYRMSFGFLDKHKDLMTCRLNFDVPVRVMAVQRAEFVGQIDGRNYVIGLTPPTADIEYQIAKGAFNETKPIRTRFNKDNSECRKCLWDRTGDPRTGTLPPYTYVVDGSGQVDTLFDLATDPRDDQTPQISDWATGRPSLVTAIFNVYTDQSDAIGLGNEPDQAKSDGQSSSSHAVWIGVAAGSAIGLVVLIVVISVLLVSRRSSSTPTVPQLEVDRADTSHVHNNFYSQETANGHATFNGPQTFRQLPCPPDSSVGLPKGGSVEYEELGVFCPEYSNINNTYDGDAANGDPSTAAYESLMLPGQRLNLPQNNQHKSTSEASVLEENYSTPRPGRKSVNSIVESGDEDTVEDSTYIVMHNPNREKEGQDV